MFSTIAQEKDEIYFLHLYNLTFLVLILLNKVGGYYHLPHMI